MESPLRHLPGEFFDDGSSCPHQQKQKARSDFLEAVVLPFLIKLFFGSDFDEAWQLQELLQLTESFNPRWWISGSYFLFSFFRLYNNHVLLGLTVFVPPRSRFWVNFLRMLFPSKWPICFGLSFEQPRGWFPFLDFSLYCAQPWCRGYLCLNIEHLERVILKTKPKICYGQQVLVTPLLQKLNHPKRPEKTMRVLSQILSPSATPPNSWEGGCNIRPKCIISHIGFQT